MNRLNRNTFTVLLVGLLVLTGLQGIVGAESLFYDPDVWWHLRIGEWIVEQRAVPQTDPFSSYGADRLWVSYSWLSDLLMYWSYAAFGLAGVVMFVTAVWLLIVVALCGLLLRVRPAPLVILTLVLVGHLAISRLGGPRPWLLSILFFIVQLDILLTAGRRRALYLLCLLPPLYVVWTACHIQFVNGLVVLGLALVESAAARFPRLPSFLEVDEAIPFTPLCATAVLCFAATFFSPYHYHTYEAVWDLVHQVRFWDMLFELRAMGFRTLPDWLVLGLTLAAAAALGWKRRVRCFLLLLWLAGLYFSFRSSRDVWFVTVASLVVLADAVPDELTIRLSLGWPRWLGVATAACGLLAAASRATLSNARLEESVARNFPDRALAFIDQQEYPGPAAHSVTWGGYWMWRNRRLPVALDWRTTVHGQDRILRHMGNWSGQPGWENDPELRDARLVLVERATPLHELLRRSGKFEQVYEDELAAVLIRK
ncbi:MAG: hypothetical protein JNM56_12820 [Planctomycetia bacterium]|nr:hypothetical protein [Planctomycetia bacterium]